MKNLENLFSKYAECSGETVEEIENLKRLRFEFQGIVGLNHYDIKFHSSQSVFYPLTKTDYQSKLSPDIGLGVSFTSLRRDRLSANLSLLYSNIKLTGNYYSEIDNKESNFDFQYNCFTSNLSFGIRPIRAIPLYFTLGISLGILDETHSEWVDTFGTSSPREREFESNKFQAGFTTSIGYQINRIGFELMYQRTNGISEYANLTDTMTRLHFLVKYTITSNEN
jgi:hypothetical protein